MKKFYDRPTQVLFVDEGCISNNFEYDVWVNEGIAFEDKIICLCCGSIVEPDDVIWMTEIPWIYPSEVHTLNYYDVSKEKKEEAVDAIRNYLKED